jgi:hypothetical protein
MTRCDGSIEMRGRLVESERRPDNAIHPEIRDGAQLLAVEVGDVHRRIYVV